MIVHCRLDSSWTFFLSCWLDAWWWLVYWRLPILLIGYICLILTMKKNLMAGRSDSGQIFQICDIPAANLWTLVLIVPRWILMVWNYLIMFRGIQKVGAAVIMRHIICINCSPPLPRWSGAMFFLDHQMPDNEAGFSCHSEPIHYPSILLMAIDVSFHATYLIYNNNLMKRKWHTYLK